MKQVGRALLRTGEGVIHVLSQFTGHRRREVQRRAQYARERDKDTWGRD